MVDYVIQKFKKYFIPHPGNDHRPHILRPRTIAFVFIVMLAAESSLIIGSTYIVPHVKLLGLIEANALIDEANQQRVANGFGVLQENALLDQAAQDKANDMAANSYFAHTSPSGATPWSWFEKAGYQFSYAGENLAVDFSNSQDVTNAWMNSPEHRANILNNSFTQIGMATAQGTLNGHSATFVVEEFGTPAAAPLAFVNTASAASVASPVPTPAPVTTAPVKTPAAAPSPKPKPKPVVPVSPVPGSIVIASASVEGSSSQQLFVAVKGAETQTVPVATATTTGASATTSASVPVATAAPAPASVSGNWAQWLISNPRAIANDFYLFLIILFAFASVLNFFIKIRIQFPRLVLGGLTVIAISGLCVLLNQNVGLLHAAIM